MAAAIRFVSSYCESLQPSLQTLLTESVKSHFLSDMSKANQKYNAARKMENDAEYVPRSIKLDCKIYCSELAKKDPEYTDLSQALKTAVGQFQDSAKQVIIRSTKMDARVHQQAAKKTFCEALASTSQFYAKMNDHNLNSVHKFAATIIERHHEAILPIFGLEDFRTIAHFKSEYIKYSTATDPLPQPFIAPDNLVHNVAGNVANVIQIAQAQAHEAQVNAVTTRNERTLSQLWTTLQTCYIQSWNIFLATQKKNAKDLELKKISTSLLVTTATENATMEVDEEQAMPPEVLQGLIDQRVAQTVAQKVNQAVSLAVAKATAALEKKLIKGKDQNSQLRGQPRGASHAKRNSSPRHQHKKGDRNLDGAEEDGVTSNDRPVPRRSNERSHSKKNTSQNHGRGRRRRSRNRRS